MYESIKQKELKTLRKTSNGLGFFIIAYFVTMFLCIIFVATVMMIFTDDTEALQSSNSIPMFLISIFASVFSALIPGLFYFLFSRKNMFQTISMRYVKLNVLFPVIFIGMAVAMIANTASDIVSNNFSFFGLENTVDFNSSSPTLLGNILYVIGTAITPAFAEEFAFRGVIMGSLRKYGDAFAIIASAIMFGAMHGNIVQIPFAFILGLIFGYIDCKTNSLVPSIIIHFLNNFYAVLIDIFKTEDIISDKTFYLIYLALIIIFCILGIISLIYMQKNHKNFFIMNNKTGITYEAANILTLKEKFQSFFTNIGIMSSLIIFICSTVGNLNFNG